MRSSSRFSLRFYIKGDDFLRENLRIFCQWISNRFPDLGKVVISVSGEKEVKSWTTKGTACTILYTPNDRNDTAYIRLCTGIDPFYHADSQRRRADYYVWAAIEWIVVYRDWWLHKRRSRTVKRRMVARLMNEWIDYIDNGETTREERTSRKEFFEACKRGKYALVSKMLQKGMNPNFRYRDCTPLAIAVENESIRLVRILVTAGAKINFFFSDWTAVHEAAAFGCSRILEYLLENGGDPNLRDLTYKAKTPMQHAQEYEQTSAICVLRRFEMSRSELEASILPSPRAGTFMG
ncbi:MAG: ankyrin repeat domain-containing protein [Kiritimatiellae bacterium]|nr:ankyrin repeat domain-containing protein [Kiritimatiellia bacterium]